MVVTNLIRKMRLREHLNASSSYRKGSSGNADPDFTKIQSILDLVRNGGGLERSQTENSSSLYQQAFAEHPLN